MIWHRGKKNDNRWLSNDKKKMYFIALHVLRHTDVVITLHVNDSLMLLVVELL